MPSSASARWQSFGIQKRCIGPHGLGGHSQKDEKAEMNIPTYASRLPALSAALTMFMTEVHVSLHTGSVRSAADSHGCYKACEERSMLQIGDANNFFRDVEIRGGDVRSTPPFPPIRFHCTPTRARGQRVEEPLRRIPPPACLRDLTASTVWTAVLMNKQSRKMTTNLRSLAALYAIRCGARTLFTILRAPHAVMSINIHAVWPAHEVHQLAGSVVI